MRRGLLALLLGGCCPYSLAELPTVEGLAEAAQFAIVRDGRSVCGAVAIGPELAVTAEHCAPGAGVRYAARDGSGFRVAEARVLARAEADDLALLELPEPAAHWAPVTSAASLYLGAPVWTRNGWSYVIDPAEWARARDGSGVLTVVADSPTFPGMSGSALLDRFGRLVGVCRGADASGQHAAYAPASAVAALWRER